MIEQKNVLVAIVVSIAILFGWQYFIEGPRIDKQQALMEKQRLEEEARQKAAGAQPAVPGRPPTSETATPAGSDLGPNLGAAGLGPNAAPGATREAALAQSPRVKIRSNRLDGSISLIGGRIDDLVLRDYRETLDPESANIVLLHPTRSERPYYAEFGWIGKGVKLPKADTRWTANGTVLSPGKPVTLSWDNGEGLVFELTYALDDNYMMTLTQRVKNQTDAPVTLTPYGLLSRTSTPEILGFYILHEGLIGVLNGVLEEIDYEDVREGEKAEYTTTGGWLGITDKYWLAALIPDQKEEVRTRFIAGKRGALNLYQADYLAQPKNVASGGAETYSVHLFAGAKEVKLLELVEPWLLLKEIRLRLVKM